MPLLLLMLEGSWTSFHHQPEAQHPKSSAIHKLPADYPIFRWNSGHTADITGMAEFDPLRTFLRFGAEAIEPILIA
jgi:hypothetical protein